MCARCLQTRETDTRTLMSMYSELAYADLDNESVYDMSEANMVKVGDRGVCCCKDGEVG